MAPKKRHSEKVQHDNSAGSVSRGHSARREDDDRVAAAREQFRLLDLNGDAVISREEMMMVLSSLDPKKWDDAAFNVLWKEIDQGDDGSVNQEEFLAWIFGDNSNAQMVQEVEAVMLQGQGGEQPAYLVLELLDNIMAYLRNPKGAMVAALVLDHQADGKGGGLVHDPTRSWVAESAFRQAQLPPEVPIVLFMDAAKTGGNYLPSAAFGLLAKCGFNLGDEAQLKLVIAAPTLKTPRACLLGSSCLQTRYFLWELQNVCAKHNYGGKVAFVPRESLYVGQQTLYEKVIADTVTKLNAAPSEKRNLGAGPVKEYVIRMCETLEMEKGELEIFKYGNQFAKYTEFEPEKDWVSRWPPGYGADPYKLLKGHKSPLLVDPDESILFDIGDCLSEGLKIIDPRAAEASPETVFVVTRKGLSGKVGRVLKAMAEDPGVTIFTPEHLESRFGSLPSLENEKKRREYISLCLEFMDGICILDFSVDWWENGFLFELLSRDSVTTVTVIDPEAERYGMNEIPMGEPGHNFYNIEFLKLREKVPTAAMSLLLLPAEDASSSTWANAAAFLWHSRQTHDGVLVLPNSVYAEGEWGPKFLATWLSITSATLRHRISGHLSICPTGSAHNVFMPFYTEGESSSASITHAHELRAAGPLSATYTISCGKEAGFRLEKHLDRLSDYKIFGGKRTATDVVYMQAAGETSDDHGDNSLDEGDVRYATVAGGGKKVENLIKTCVESVETILTEVRESEYDDWKAIVDGDVGLRTFVLESIAHLCKALET